MGKRNIIGLAAFVLGLGLASSSFGQITSTLESINPSLPSPLDVVFLSGAGNLNEGVGAINWLGASTNPSPFNTTYTTYCLDLVDNIIPGTTYTYSLNTNIANSPQASAYPAGLSGPMGSAKATQMDELFGEAYVNSFKTTTNESAFQLAIWSIVYNTPTTITSVNNNSANFHVVSGADLTTAAINQANAWLTGLSSSIEVTNLEALTGLTSAGGDIAQDQIFAPGFPNLGGNPSPLPTPALSVAVLLAGYGLYRWRRNTQIQ